jgi:cell division protein FtsB
MALSRRLAAAAPAVLVLGIAGYYAVWGGEYSAFDLRRLDGLQAEEQAALVVAYEEVDSLRAEAARLEKDPAAIERVARERFGMIRDGEVLYRFVHVDSSALGDARVAAAP